MTKKESAAAASRKPAERAAHAPPPAKVSGDEGAPRPPASGAAAAAEAGKRRRVAVVMATVGVVAVVACIAIGAYVATTSSSSSGAAGQRNANLSVITVTTTTPTMAFLSTAAPRPAPLQQAVTFVPISVSSVNIGRAGGRPVMKYMMTNNRGVQVDLISIGARINALRIPTASGLVDVVAGHDEGNITVFQQSTLGTVNGRICSTTPWSFAYNNLTYAFTQSANARIMYSNGGVDGFYTKNYESFVDAQNVVHFLYNSSAGADGIPGLVWVHVTYQLTVESELVILMTLSTDRLSPVDMCSSVAFNLCGASSGNISGQMLRLFTTTTAENTGGREVTKQTANFQEESNIYELAKMLVDQGQGGYDFVFRAQQPAGKALLARATCISNKISMEVYSDQRGLRVDVPQQDLAQLGKYGMNYTGFPYFTLQPQRYTMTSQGRNFGILMLQAGDVYSQQTSYKLAVSS